MFSGPRPRSQSDYAALPTTIPQETTTTPSSPVPRHSRHESRLSSIPERSHDRLNDYYNQAAAATMDDQSETQSRVGASTPHQHDVNRTGLPTLFEVLSRRTLPPVDLFSFYIYMRDQQRSVDYLDFW